MQFSLTGIRKILSNFGAIIGLLIGISAIFPFPPFFDAAFPYLLGGYVEQGIILLFESLSQEAIFGWFLLPIGTAIVGAIYGYIIGFTISLFQKDKPLPY